MSMPHSGHFHSGPRSWHMFTFQITTSRKLYQRLRWSTQWQPQLNGVSRSKCGLVKHATQWPDGKKFLFQHHRDQESNGLKLSKVQCARNIFNAWLQTMRSNNLKYCLQKNEFLITGKSSLYVPTKMAISLLLRYNKICVQISGGKTNKGRNSYKNKKEKPQKAHISVQTQHAKTTKKTRPSHKNSPKCRP